MADRLDGARRKIERSQAHLHEIEQALDSFVGSAFQSLTSEFDPKTGERFFVLHELRRPEEGISILIGDCLHNLRSALDHLAFQLVKHPASAVTGPRTADHKIAFPICDNPTKFEAAKWRLRGAMPDVEAVVERLQPYPGRNSPLVFHESRLGLLRDLNDWDKHRLLHVIENGLGRVGFFSELLESWSARDPGPLEAPTELARYKVLPSQDPNVDVGFHLSTYVAFEGGPANGLTVTQTLAGMRYEVSQIVEWLARYVAVP